MVQKGKLAACALPFSTMALKRVDWFFLLFFFEAGEEVDFGRGLE